MNTSGRQWISQNAELDFGFSCEISTVKKDDGPLAHLDQPTVVMSSQGTVLMLSVSGGMLSASPESVLIATAEQILDVARVATSSGDELVWLMRRQIKDLFENGAFYEAIPHGALLALSAEGSVCGARFGPVGIAAVNRGDVRLLHRDERFAALREQGARLDDIVSPMILANPLVCAVTSLVQLDPSGSDAFSLGEMAPEAELMMMNRGALPFTIPQHEAPLDEWSQMEAGWMHGMSGTIVQVFRRDSRPATHSWPSARYLDW